MGDVPALGRDIEACSSAIAGERKAERSKGHYSKQQKPSERFHKRPFANLGIPMIRDGPSYSIDRSGDIAIESHCAYHVTPILSMETPQ
jgi:hypothetical protein